MKLKNKNILLGVTASIAAYKSAYLTRLFVKEGANVKVIMTPAAKEFITPLTLSTLSGNPVISDFFVTPDDSWNNHIEIGTWASLMVLAPTTATTLGKMANGICDNLLITTYLSARCPIVIAPAMDVDMYHHPTTQNNINTLKGFGNIIIDSQEGELASGLSGKGRMEEPDVILKRVIELFKKKNS